MISLFGLYKSIINEGLIKSAEREKALSILKKKFTEEEGFKIEENWKIEPNTIKVEYTNGSKQRFDEFRKYVDNLGWFISYIHTPSYKGKYKEGAFSKKSTFCILEQKYNTDTDVKDRDRVGIPTGKEVDYSTLYHLTPTKNVPKILKIGLSPRSGSKITSHPDRIYVAIKVRLLLDLVYQMMMRTKIKEWTILQIDPSKISDKNFKLYKDPETPELGFYTTVNIPPSAIEVLANSNEKARFWLTVDGNNIFKI